jgi:hypothetical protein
MGRRLVAPHLDPCVSPPAAVHAEQVVKLVKLCVARGNRLAIISACLNEYPLACFALPAAVYAKQVVKLYTTMGLKLMDSRKFDDALTMMRKAEAVVENDAMWAQGGGGAGAPAPAPAAADAKRKRLQVGRCSSFFLVLRCLFPRGSVGIAHAAAPFRATGQFAMGPVWDVE